MKTQRNLDGVYFRVERNGKEGNVCFTDLELDEVYEVLNNKNENWIKELAVILTDTLQQIAEVAEITIAKMEIPTDRDKATYLAIVITLAAKIYTIGEMFDIVPNDDCK